MFNDLWLTNNQVKELWRRNRYDFWHRTSGARGDPLLAEHRYGCTKLAQVLARCPNSVVIGPGDAKLWGMNEYFDEASVHMLNILNSYSVTNINAVEIMRTMTKRGQIHFDNTMESRIGAANMFENAIIISDAQLRFALGRHVYVLAKNSPAIPMLHEGGLPQTTQVVANEEAKFAASRRPSKTKRRVRKDEIQKKHQRGI